MTAISSLKWKISLFLKCNPTWSKLYRKLSSRSFTCTLSQKSVDKSLQSTPKRSHLNAHFSLIGDLNGAKTQFFFFEKILRFLKQCRAETSQSDFLMAGANQMVRFFCVSLKTVTIFVKSVTFHKTVFSKASSNAFRDEFF